MASEHVSIDFTTGDAANAAGDVIILKYAQQFHGVDGFFANKLALRAGPAENEYVIVQCPPPLRPQEALFVGVLPILHFRYAEIRSFAERALNILAQERPHVRRVIATLHGPGYGLDEVEAFLAELAGFQDAIRGGRIPRHLEQIVIVEIDQQRVQRLRAATRVAGILPIYEAGDTVLIVSATGADRSTAVQQVPASLTTAGAPSESKTHVFVAMPFAPDMDDVYLYGIKKPVNALGWLCERVDQEPFVGDVLDRITNRIETARVVIADLSGANPNVYLELGYAWGCRKPTILVARSTENLRFDVQGQRCLMYGRIQDLETLLTRELSGLRHKRIIA